MSAISGAANRQERVVRAICMKTTLEPYIVGAFAAIKHSILGGSIIPKLF